MCVTSATIYSDDKQVINSVSSSVLHCLVFRKALSVQVTHLFGAQEDCQDNKLLSKEKASGKST